jgi:DNA-binding transcriptional MerR regulator
MSKLVRISDLSKILNLVDPITKKPLNHIIRYWEKEFKEIRPRKINNIRYYSSKQIELIKMIKFLLKNKGMTIDGVKNLINFDVNKLDVDNSHSLKAEYYKSIFKTKTNKLLEKVKKIKKYGKKISS